VAGLRRRDAAARGNRRGCLGVPDSCGEGLRTLVTNRARLAGRTRPRLDVDALLGGAAPDVLLIAVLLYLLLPALLFAGGFLRPWLGAAMVATGLAALGMAPGWRGGWPLTRRATILCLLGGLGWGAFCTGTHHLLYAAVDWQIRDAALHDLARGGWPVAYAIGDFTWLLRAPLGYYMPAALAGPGLDVPALFLWTALGLALVLMLLAALAAQAGAGRGGAVWIALVFVLFGGLDLLPNLWLDATQGDGIASYLGRGGEWWAREFQYSGHVTLLLWAPNHALPGWLPALLLARHARRPDFAGAVGLGLVAAAAWGPVSAFGAAALSLAAILMGGRAGVVAALRGVPNWLALVFAVPLGLFLTAGSAAIPHGWLVVTDGIGALPMVALFLVVEVFAVALVVLRLIRWRLLAVALASVALLPLYVFGPGNEMTMRGGIAPLALLALAAGLAVRQGLVSAWRRALAALLAIAVAGQLMEASILVNPAWGPSRGCTLPEAAAQSVFTDTDWSHYVVPWPEPALERLLATPEPRVVDPETVSRCWPDASR
jgi:hypothetical protein